jgi:hypothetical protein
VSAAAGHSFGKHAAIELMRNIEFQPVRSADGRAGGPMVEE